MSKLLKWMARPASCDGETLFVLLNQQHLRVCCLAMGIALAASLPAYAVDGCQVLLCLAAPNWRCLSPCMPPVTQMRRDVARGMPFPACAAGSAGNPASLRWSGAPSFCPSQYMRTFDDRTGPIDTCDYSGTISVTFQDMPFSPTSASDAGDIVPESPPTAEAQLGAWDAEFEADCVTRHAAQPVLRSN
ncbi:MAG TPA: hypothetical protein VGF12_11165 [Roseateles sp.]|uniref:hypothetical protein n=1 Tax=Roseateles sp. TaxID=1971397 RepID=UPI002ED945B5